MELHEFIGNDLIQLEDALSEFKEHHQRKGAQESHHLLKSWIDEKWSELSEKDKKLKTNKGFERGFKKAMELIRDELIFNK